ncbi:MAG TPA: undecaprenyldiphospho-muramoylpentapeptide beta-N-acetylglucosaminyltransferase [Negativicutes bacterium]|nr:undecaprenyldiphospho-muramoylpentapeptide beta-N-acetylglucosaminyltransferase [Negativicutes bacterium]
MKVLLAGGGTGGHIYPAVTIARGLQAAQPDCEILFVGTRQGLEADIIPKEGFAFRAIDVQGMQRKLSWDTLRTIGKMLKGLVQSRRIIRSFQPDVVIGTGGYVCGPVVLLASLLRIPTVIQEQNVIPGVTNKLLARLVKLVLVGFPEAAKFFPRGAVIAAPGNPVRTEIIDARKDEGLRAFALDPAKHTILVAGGSRGARTINEAMLQVYRDFAGDRNVQILHVTGTGEYESLKAKAQQNGIDCGENGNIILVPYLYNMPAALAAADLIVYRAGAVGLAEITVRGLPAILIPYPYAAENHQEYNARLLAEKGAAVVITDKELTGETLSRTISRLLSEPGKLTQMSAASRALGRPRATVDIVESILALLK